MPQKKNLRLDDIQIEIPPQRRGPIEPDENKTQERINKLHLDIYNWVLAICDNNERVAQGLLKVDYKNIVQSNDTIVEFLWEDSLIALVYVRRTEFNHQEETFFLYKETFLRVEKYWEENKEFFRKKK